jgi:hypothetical protein
MRREFFLVGSFGKNTVCDDYSEYSFYKNLPEVIVKQGNEVIDFDVTNDVMREGKTSNSISKDISSIFQNKDNVNSNIIPDVLFSGYFGKKNEEEGFNGNVKNIKNGKKINPFPKIEEERSLYNSNTSFDSMNRFGIKKQRLNSDSFSQCLKSVNLSSSFKKKSILP